MQPYHSLPRAKLFEKKKTKRLNNLPSNLEKTFYKEWAEEIDSSLDSASQRSILTNQMLSDDVKNYLLATSVFGQDIQLKIDLYLTKGHLNEASFRQKLDPIMKSVIRNDNPIELCSKMFRNLTCKIQ